MISSKQGGYCGNGDDRRLFLLFLVPNRIFKIFYNEHVFLLKNDMSSEMLFCKLDD